MGSQATLESTTFSMESTQQEESMNKLARLVALTAVILGLTYWLPMAEAYPTPLCTTLHGVSCEEQAPYATAWCWHRFPLPGHEGSCTCKEMAPYNYRVWDCGLEEVE